MIVETVEQLKQLINEFEEKPTMISNKITYANGEILEILKR